MRLDAAKFRRFEANLFREVTTIVVTSAVDQAKLRSEFEVPNPTVVANGVDLSYFKWSDHSLNRESRLVMTGTLGYHPNLDAARWLRSSLMPGLRRQVPEASLKLVGRDAPPALLELHSPEDGFDVVGEVPDVRPYLNEADLFVMPLRMGSGTRLKALEALASGVPVVSTPTGIEGLELENRRNVLTAESADALVQTMVEALRDTSLRRTVSAEGRLTVEQLFAWDQLGARFAGVLEATASSHI
jgi:glycosyltransferase involved in cell wall biosynthesis